MRRSPMRSAGGFHISYQKEVKLRESQPSSSCFLVLGSSRTTLDIRLEIQDSIPKRARTAPAIMKIVAEDILSAECRATRARNGKSKFSE